MKLSSLPSLPRTMAFLAIICFCCSLMPSSASDDVGEETMEGRRLGFRIPMMSPPVLVGNKQVHMRPPTVDVRRQPGKGGGPRDVHGGLGTMPQQGVYGALAHQVMAAHPSRP
ncbi:uncharacterized protein LOC123439248 [Hordeum vulgare subsp. vulgare]|uniref:uncharacterized protein LOC123439248 n=1 Tax=Hordeum vulgare subsp. vulgare TaxID=112509 RepID=UPI001D1A4654|nr:uncharacterized protein LOC123439248 [Hordeum vulgare subsp. vulgare]